MKMEISKKLKELGIPTNLLGYGYLRYAIQYVMENPESLHRITKELYPEVAREFKTTASRAERAIRHAIEMACLRGSTDLLYEMFRYSISSDKGKPTNSEFIATVADVMLLEKVS